MSPQVELGNAPHRTEVSSTWLLSSTCYVFERKGEIKLSYQ